MTKGGIKATPILRRAIAASAKVQAAINKAANRRFQSIFVARLIMARQHIEQQKKGTSVAGIVKCFITRDESKKSEQKMSMTVLSANNSRTRRE
jgi:hypothetical protein